MSLLRNLTNGLRSLFRKEQVDRELDEELRAYQEMATEEKMKDGLSRKEALRAVRLEQGSPGLTKQVLWSARWESFLEACWQDLRFGLRMLRKSPGYTAVAVITLALGIGANTAIFSVVDTVLLRPLPYKDPSKLLWMTEHFGASPSAVVGPDFAAWKGRNNVFEQIEAFSASSGANLTASGEPTRVSVTNVTTGLFSMLGVQPIVGRAFLTSEGKRGGEHVALLNEALWRTRFSGDPRIVGEAIRLDGTAYTVVGVMLATLRYPQADVWTPIVVDGETFSPHSSRWMILTVIGRLKSGVDVRHAQSDLQVITQQLDKEYPPQAAPFRAHEQVEVAPLHGVLVQNSSSLLIILMAATAFVLTIACVNVANLFLSRGVVRSKEIAVRAALGAGRARLIRQLLAEAVLLAVIGGLLGSATGLWGTKTLEQLIPPSLQIQIRLNPTILGFSMAIAVLALLVFGLAPAVIASRIDLNQTLKQGVWRIGVNTTTHRLRASMSAGQIALSLILLIGAGLLVKSFLRLTELDPGFDTHNLLVATVERSFTMGSNAQLIGFYQEALERMRNLPGLSDVAMTERYPLGSPHNGFLSLRVQNASNFHPAQPISITTISPGYFHLMRIRLNKGREFDGNDGPKSQPVVVINESLARMVFGNRDPLAQRVAFGTQSESWREVVGVVADVKEDAVAREPFAEIFAPYAQYPSFFMSLVLRSSASVDSLAPSIRKIVQSVDKDQPVSQILTVDELFAKSVTPRRFRMLLLGFFALLALLLALIGIYGAIGYSCSQRTREFGVRIALGAERLDILELVIWQGFILTMTGIGIGIAGAFALTRYLTSLLYGVKPTDPLTFVLVSVVLGAAALFASYIPARRAMRVDPMVALRYE